VENQATVFYLQRVGRSGCLTTLEVEGTGAGRREWKAEGWVVAAAGLTLAAAAVLVGVGDWWAVGVLGGLVVTRMISLVVLRRRRSKW
jgi:hypothetical protein